MESEYPKFRQMAENLAKTAGDVVSNAAQGGGVFCSKSVKERRMAICKSCQHYDMSQGRCKECGCYLESKTSLKATKCPIDKWSFDLP